MAGSKKCQTFMDNMIQVKTFAMNSKNLMHHDRLDNSINKFLQENDVEVIDIKYSTCCYSDTAGHEYWIPTAMLIYKNK